MVEGSRHRLSTQLVTFTVALLAILPLVQTSVAPANASRVSLGGTSTDFDTVSRLDALLDRKDDYVNTPDILEISRDRIIQLSPKDRERSDPAAGVEERTVPIPDPTKNRPNVFEAIQDSFIHDNKYVVDWLPPNPVGDGALRYLVYTRSSNTTHWTQGSLRRTLFDYDVENGSYIFEPNFSKFIDIDVDDRDDTGNREGADIAVRLNFNYSINKLSVNLNPLERDRFEIEDGAMEVNIQRLGTQQELPLEVVIVKSVSYSGTNYIWTVGFSFEDLPRTFDGYLNIRNIRFGGLAQNVMEGWRDVLNNIMSGELPDLNSTLSDIQFMEFGGPYSVGYRTRWDLSALDIILGMERVVESKPSDDITWITFDIDKAVGLTRIPGSGTLTLDSSSMLEPLDRVAWNSDDRREGPMPAELRLQFAEERSDLTYADVLLSPLPEELSIDIQYTQDDLQNNVTILDFTASRHLDRLEFHEYIFYEHRIRGFSRELAKFNSTHVVLSDLPLAIHLEATSDLGRAVTPVSVDDGEMDIGARVIDSMLSRVVGRLSRVGTNLRILPENFLTLPARKGYSKMECLDSSVGCLEFIQSSGGYATLEDNHVLFMVEPMCSPVWGCAPNSATGLLRNITRFESSFRDGTAMSLSFTGPGERLKVVSISQDDAAIIDVPEVPSAIWISTGSDQVEVRFPKDESLEELSYVSIVDNTYTEMGFLNLTGGLGFERFGRGISLKMMDGGNLGVFQFFIAEGSNTTLQEIPGNFAMVNLSGGRTMMSGRLLGLQGLDYSVGKGGYANIEFDSSRQLSVYMSDEDAGPFDGSVIIDPLPASFNLTLPGLLNTSVPRFPDIVNITGIFDYRNTIFSLGEMGDSLTDVLLRMEETLLDSLGGLGNNLSFSYDLEAESEETQRLDIIARFRKGPDSLHRSLGWTHGAIIFQENTSDQEILLGNLFLEGLPSRANISFSLGSDRTELDLVLEDYSPQFDWVLLDTRGVQGQDAMVLLEGIDRHTDLSMQVELEDNMSIGGRITGFAHIESNKHLGELYINIRKSQPVLSVREVYFSSVPTELNLELDLHIEGHVRYQASDSLDMVFVQVSKSFSDNWYHMTVTLHDVPEEFDMETVPSTQFDMDKPTLFQGLSTIRLDTDSSDLDAFIKWDGGASGQRSDFMVILEDVQDMSMGVEDGRLVLRSSHLGYILLVMSDSPVSSTFHLEELVFESEDFRTAQVEMEMLFGALPVFHMDHMSARALKISVHSRLQLFGKWRDARAVLGDFSFSSSMPTETVFRTNTIAVDRSASDHRVVPAPMLSFWFMMGE